MLENEAITEARKSQCERLRLKTCEIQDEIQEQENKINSAPTEIINIQRVRTDIQECKVHISNLAFEIETSLNENEKNKEKIEKATVFIDGFEIERLRKTQTLYEEKLNSIQKIKDDLSIAEDKLQLLSNDECFTCSQEITEDTKEKIQQKVEEKKKILEQQTQEAVSNSISNNDLDNLLQEINKFEELVKIKDSLENQIPTQALFIENLISRKSLAEHELKDFQNKEKIYEENKEVIENLNEIISQKNDKQKTLNSYNQELKQCEKILLNLYKAHGYYEQKIENLKEQKAQKEQSQNEFEAFDLYMRAMHPNGIAYDIIKKSLPIINSEISKVLANLVDFEVFFETEDNRLDIYIKHLDRDPSPLEMASGAEKTVSAMAVRLAFIAVSTIPRSQLFVLDEPGTSLDEERMEGFTRILEIVKSVFKTVLLISHLDNLKDSADSVITIEKKDGYANVVA